MAIHTYTCPKCKNLIRVKAEAGRIVEVEPCEACALEALEGDADAIEAENEIARDLRTR